MQSRMENGKYKNLDDSTHIGTSTNMLRTVMDYFFQKDRRPSKPLETVIQDYTQLKNDQYVWFGHSSILLKKHNKTVLIDPVFGQFTSIVTPFKLTQEFEASTLQFPYIDILIITHDHVDHLHTKVLKQLQKRKLIDRVIVPLDNTKYIKHIFSASQITECDWGDVLKIDNLTIQCVPARHYSWRNLILCDKYTSLWAGFLIDDVYYTSDSSMNKDMFKDIYSNAVIKPVYCFLEFGQYNRVSWPDNHMLPEQGLQAFDIVKAKYLIPVHFGRYTLAPHPWYEPVQYLSEQNVHYFVGRMGKIYDFEYVKNNGKHIDSSFLQYVKKNE